jgi:ElaA protein
MLMASSQHDVAGCTLVTTVRDALLTEVDPVTLYRILALRSEVFVVEQECVYLDLDGRDLEPDARQVWAERDGAVLATLRLLRDPAAARIGRVVTAPAARGTGIAALLMHHALELAGPGDVVLDAQAHLADWYGRLGFVRDGAEFVEDGIPHVPMRRAGR